MNAYLQVPDDPGREVVLEKVARPFERRLLADPGVAHCTTTIQSGAAVLEIELQPGQDAEETAGRLREALASVLASGPAESTGEVSRYPSAEEQSGLIVQLSGAERDRIERELVPRLRRIEGIREVWIFPPKEERLDLLPIGVGPTLLPRIRSENTSISSRSTV